MGSLGLFAKYPVLPEARDWLRAQGPGLDALLTDFLYGRARDRARQRVWAAFDEGRKATRQRADGDASSDPRDVTPSSLADAADPFDLRGDPIAGGDPLMISEIDEEMELVSHPLARMLVAATGEDFLVRRFAVQESKRLSHHLERDPAETVSAVATALEVPFSRRLPEEDPSGATGHKARTFGLHFTDYLARAPNEKTWRLVWRDLERGAVWLDKEAFARLVEHVYKGKLEDDLTGQSAAVPGILRETMGPELVRLKAEAERRTAAYRKSQQLEMNENAFPPCINRILQDMHDHVNIPHMGRFAIVAFLHTLGKDTEGILKFFSTIPDFNAEKSRYQIEHITGRGGPTEYTPPGCSTMQTYGVCPLDERDDICADVKHPLSYYRRNLWRHRKTKQAEPGGDGKEVKGDESQTAASAETNASGAETTTTTDPGKPTKAKRRAKAEAA